MFEMWRSHRILEYLQAMRNYFLLEAGDTMYDFYTAIFDKVQEKESWQQPSFLNVQLQEAVGQRHSEDSSRYYILNTSHSSCVNIVFKDLIVWLYYNIELQVICLLGAHRPCQEKASC